jgi:2-isopropylmalate synthase
MRVIEAVIDAGRDDDQSAGHVGYSTPDEIGHFFVDVMTHVPNATVRSSARTATTTSAWPVANTIAAIGAGVRQVECTINGIGERAATRHSKKS